MDRQLTHAEFAQIRAVMILWCLGGTALALMVVMWGVLPPVGLAALGVFLTGGLTFLGFTWLR